MRCLVMFIVFYHGTTVFENLFTNSNLYSNCPVPIQQKL